VRKPCSGALAALAAAALAAGVAGCGGSSEPEAHPIRTVGARPDIKITKVAGGRRTPQVAAAIAMERSKNPGPGTDLVPLPPSIFNRPVARYRVYSAGQVKAMLGDVAQLRTALVAGDVPAAKNAWFDAYDHYLRLGAAYGALGALDEEIDGNPGRLPGGVHSPEFTGLHRIEWGLWNGESPAKLVAPTDYLAAKVKRLRIVVKKIQIGPLTYATRAHEILEDAQRDMLSDVDAPWSGAGLRATADSLAATEFVIGTLRTVLAGREGSLEPVETEMAVLREKLHELKREHGGAWPPLEAMTEAQHGRIDGALGALLERLAAIPGALEAHRTRPIPTIAEQEESRQ
jgi:iron uptake system EfeUOB component EfeO/EfeM